jgi:dihydroorotate dehydrogenase electron transfer subunit
MKKYMLDMVVSANEMLGDSHFLLKLTHNEALPEMQPGQFVQVRVDGEPDAFLRRPISVNFVDKERNELWLLVQKVGAGTRKMAQYSINQYVNVLLPLGNSFSYPTPAQSKILLVGGGVGVAPLLFLGSELRANGFDPMFLLGARKADALLQIGDFENLGEVLITTEDGSMGEKGFVTQHSVWQTNVDVIYTCGPTPMMEAVVRLAIKRNIPCQVSLENKMACGFGACLCCVTQTNTGHRCVCTEGPVFNSNELSWQI